MTFYAHPQVPALACSDLSTQDGHLCPLPPSFFPSEVLSSLKSSVELASSNVLPPLPLHHPLQTVL